MMFKGIPRFGVIAPIAGAAALALSLSMGVVSASSAQNGQLHLVKECSENTGVPGTFCTFTVSNLEQIIPIGAQVIYAQGPIVPGGDNAFPGPNGYLDSNVVLFAGTGNWAVGRCTLDGSTGVGVCTFSDGIGAFTGFEARVDVAFCPTCLPVGSGFTWDGTYRFRSQPKR